MEMDNDVVFPSPVHNMFGLSYASFFVLPRVLMEQMPNGWQKKFVELFDEYSDEFPDWCEGVDIEVKIKDCLTKRYQSIGDHPMSHYRYPNYNWVESVRKVEENNDNK